MESTSRSQYLITQSAEDIKKSDSKQSKDPESILNSKESIEKALDPIGNYCYNLLISFSVFYPKISMILWNR